MRRNRISQGRSPAPYAALQDWEQPRLLRLRSSRAEVGLYSYICVSRYDGRSRKEVHMPDPVLVTAISNLLAPLPSITEEKTPTHATYCIGRKIFAFTRSGGGGGVAIKLPKE